MPNIFEDLPEPTTPLGIDLPDEKLILQAVDSIADPLDRARALYYLSRRYRALSIEALEECKKATNAAHATGAKSFKEIAEYCGAKSSSSLTGRAR